MAATAVDPEGQTLHQAFYQRIDLHDLVSIPKTCSNIMVMKAARVPYVSHT
jgi:hypothetical protein